MTSRKAFQARTTLVVAGFMAVFAVLALPSAVAVSSVGTVAWWTDRTAAIALPPGSFEVARSGDGVSVAAVEVVQSGAVGPTTLVLQEIGGFATATATLQVCVISAGFPAASRGPIAEAPTTSCATPTELLRGTDASWRADITGDLIADQRTGFAIVPAPASPGSLPFDPGYTVDFLSATVEFAPPADGIPSTQPTSTSTTVGSGGGASTTTAPFFVGAAPSAIVPRPVAPPAPVARPDPSVTPTTVGAPVDERTAEDLQVGQFTVGPISGRGDTRPWIRLLILLPMSAVTGAGAAYGKKYLDERGESVAA